MNINESRPVVLAIFPRSHAHLFPEVISFVITKKDIGDNLTLVSSRIVDADRVTGFLMGYFSKHNEVAQRPIDITWLWQKEEVRLVRT